MKKILQFVRAAFSLFLFLTVVDANAQDIIARGGTLTVSQDNSGGPSAGEGSPKLIDNDHNTKFLTGSVSYPLLITFQANAPSVLGLYTFTSANDAAIRDPKNWTLEASNDGTNWTVLDTRTNQQFSTRHQTRAFFVPNNTTPYSYYRINISSTNGSSIFQMAEWRLLEETPPAIAPTDLTVNAVSGASIMVQWTDSEKLESGYELERSEGNSNNFVRIATLGANTVNYTDNGLRMNTRYYYRVRAISPYGETAYSSTATTSTLNLSGEVRDITDNGGTYTTSHENGSGADGGEGSKKLLDNNKSTKFLVGGAFPTGGIWMQYQSSAPDEIVMKYSITSGNDAPGRDPKNWVFQGSNDGTTWTALDTRVNQTFPGRNQTIDFAFTNTRPFEYYRWLVTANNGEGGVAIQVSELEIWGISQSAPAVPTNLQVTDVTEREISLSWNDVATNESGYEIQRSTDGVNFTSVTTVGANTSTYTDTNLRVLTRYFYRVRATKEGSNSIFSQIVDETTLYDENLPVPVVTMMATPISENEVELSWEDRADNETGYEIERSLDGETFTNIATLDADATDHTDTGLRLASRYYYRVRPFNDYSQAAAEGAPYSDVASVITLGTNQAPSFAEVANASTCNVVDIHSIAINNVSNGPEPDQNVTFSVTSNRPAMFSELSVTEVVDGVATVNYKLNPGQVGDATITVTAKDNAGTFNNGSDTYSRTFTISGYELQVDVASSITTDLVPRGEIVQLTATGDGNYTYTWADGPGIMSGQDSNVLTIKPTQGYVYKVTASTPEGCTQEAEFTIQMDGGVNLQANNILTPNGDGKNDVWVIWNVNTFIGNKLKVFDTAGRVVYEAENYTNDWDGTSNGSPLAQGVYYYILDLGSGIPAAKGSLTIIRE